MIRTRLIQALSVALGVFTLVEVNYPRLTPQGDVAIFAAIGLTICVLLKPYRPSGTPGIVDSAWILLTVLTCGYVLVQSEPVFQALWVSDRSLGDRAGAELPLDFAVGALGLAVVLEVTRRSVGWALPLLALVFVCYAAFGPAMPDWLFPHRGYEWSRIVSASFLQSQGVFGMAMKVMFVYVYLFVVFGAVLEVAGASQFIIDLAGRTFRRSTGGPAKVSVLASGLMGSLSGSAVANAAATGAFTIPMMRSAGFPAAVAGGVCAAASAGGALMPPVMGAGAYMMLEIIDPPVTYLGVIRAALLPAILYYLSLLLIVHLYAKSVGSAPIASAPPTVPSQTGAAPRFIEATLFFGSLGTLIALLLAGNSPFRAVSVAMVFVFVVAAVSPRTRIGGSGLLRILEGSARGGVALVAAAACVGIVIAVVTMTGVGTRFASVLLPVAQGNLFLALGLIMVASIVLGMGLPSAVCYLLLATIIGPPLAQLGVVPLSAHLFIFYFGMLSMVTPPVALAAFTAASIAKASVMATAMAAFRFSLVGFSLPFVFVERPQLLMLSVDGSTAPFIEIAWSFTLALAGIVPLAGGVSGYLFSPLGRTERLMLVAAAVMVLYPAGPVGALWLSWLNGIGFGIVAVVALLSWRRRLVDADPA